MNPQEENKDMHNIDDIEHSLYDPKENTDDFNLHHMQSHRGNDIPIDWGRNTQIITPASPNEGGYSFGTKVLFVAMGILCVVLAFTAWRVLSSRNVVSATSIDITIDSKSYVEGGEQTPFSVSVLNRNTIALDSAVLTVSYEKGVGSQDEQEKVYEKRVLGIISPNTIKKEDMNIVLYGAESDTRNISVKLEYKVAGANATFDKTVTTSVVLKTPPLSVHVDGPTSLVQGQEGVFKIKVSNNTSLEIKNSLVSVSLPTTFTLRSSDPKSSSRGTTWALPSIMPGATSTIIIYGAFIGEPGETANMKASVGSGTNGSQIAIIYSQEGHGVSITSPLLSLGVKLETDRGNAENLRYGDRAVVVISYANKSASALIGTSIVANIGGSAAVLSGVTSDAGYYNSLDKTVTWNSATNNGLGSIAPGAVGELRMYIPIVSKGNIPPKLILTINGVATAVTKDDTATHVSKTWSVEGSATFSAWSAYKNKSFVNSGPLPPQANVDTTYTAHMIVSAQNALVNGRVSFILPIYVNYTGVYATGTNVTYDQRTRTVVWNIGSISAGAVVSNDIQLKVRPSQSHVGQTPPITSGVTLEADESDSKARIRMVSGALNTDLSREQGGQDLSRVIGN